MSKCCNSKQQEPVVNTKTQATSSCCDVEEKRTFDWITWLSVAFIVGMLISLAASQFTALPPQVNVMVMTTIEMLKAMWWGIFLGIFAVGWLNRIPKEVVIKTLGPGHTQRGLLRATLAGVLFDLCNHGILMIAMKLYERGASLGQVMAFLIASPWNSFTLTLILIGLIGWQMTLVFILFSVLIAWISGSLFDYFERKGHVRPNPNTIEVADNYRLRTELRSLWQGADLSNRATINMLKDGVSGAQMVIRWILFGIVMVALIRAFVPEDVFGEFFGPTAAGMLFTLLVATVMEVCSEGSTPIAADLVNRAGAPGNGFTFLMAGASTDYTEIMAIKDTMKSWKIALLLPLVTVPQILLLGWLLNQFS